MPGDASEPPPHGPLAGALLGLAAGVLLSSIWLFGDWDVALAVTAIFGGLVAVLLVGSPAGKPFATALLASAAVTGAVIFSIAWWG